jgi:hypothetical protein
MRPDRATVRAKEERAIEQALKDWNFGPVRGVAVWVRGSSAPTREHPPHLASLLAPASIEGIQLIPVGLPSLDGSSDELLLAPVELLAKEVEQWARQSSVARPGYIVCFPMDPSSVSDEDRPNWRRHLVAWAESAPWVAILPFQPSAFRPPWSRFPTWLVLLLGLAVAALTALPYVWPELSGAANGGAPAEEPVAAENPFASPQEQAGAFGVTESGIGVAPDAGGPASVVDAPYRERGGTLRVDTGLSEGAGTAQFLRAWPRDEVVTGGGSRQSGTVVLGDSLAGFQEFLHSVIVEPSHASGLIAVSVHASMGGRMDRRGECANDPETIDNLRVTRQLVSTLRDYTHAPSSVSLAQPISQLVSADVLRTVEQMASARIRWFYCGAVLPISGDGPIDDPSDERARADARKLVALWYLPEGCTQLPCTPPTDPYGDCVCHEVSPPINAQTSR